MKIYKNNFLIHMGLVIFAMPILDSHAEIFKCTSKEGSIYYNDKPCPVKDEEQKMSHVEEIKNGYVPAFPLESDLNQDKSKNLRNKETQIATIGRDEKPAKPITIKPDNSGLPEKSSEGSITIGSLLAGAQDDTKQVPSSKAYSYKLSKQKQQKNQLRNIKTY